MELPERESMAFDVVVVGAGPAGLSTAIRLKQLAAEKGAEVSVVVVEKGSEVGAHILSGAVIDPIGLDRLVPDWREDPERPLKTEVARDEFLYLTAASGLRMPQWPMPRLMSNHGNFIGSLGDVCRYLGRKAEELGVEIYPGFPAAEVLVDGERPRRRRRHRRSRHRPRRQAEGSASPAAWSCAATTPSSPRARAAT